MATAENRIILGIDPGTNLMGYGIISVKANQLKMVHKGVLNLQRVEDPFEKLAAIYRQVYSLIESYDVGEMAIEAPFFGKNVQSMLKLGRAQGVAIAAALAHRLDVTEYSPRKIKQSITGNGSSTKEQVALMLERILHIGGPAEHLDETDALAVAVCHYFQRLTPTAAPAKGTKKTGSWKAFLTANPDRLKK